MGLQQFERRLERLFEGTFAKVFRSGLEPVELGRRLVREMDRGRKVGATGMVAPNSFAVRLAPADHDRFSGFESALTEQLVGLARDHARDERYAFLGPVTVALQVDEAQAAGTIAVAALVHAAPGGGPVGSLVLVGGRRVQLGERTITLGRLEDCDIVLEDPTVSRHHAQVRRAQDGFELVDLGSRNGTRVNGHGIMRQRLADGDAILVGAVAMTYEAV